MGDLEQITQLVERLLTSTHNSMEAADARQRDLLQQLVAGRPNAEALRAEKVAKLGAALRKSTKIKDFKEGEMPVKEWLRRWNHEVESLRKLCGLPDDLTREEGIGLFKDMLDFSVVKRVELVFLGRDPVVTWANVDWEGLSGILRDEFGPKVSQVGQVLQQFGPQRFKKTDGMTVATFTHDWIEQLPECMCPTTEAEFRQFADLMRRTMFYYCLNDTYIQRDLCDMDGEPTFKAYFDQAVLSEQKRKSFQEIGDSGAKLDPGGAACLALLEDDQMSQAGGASINYGAAYKQPGGQSRGRGRGSKFGRGAGGSSYGDSSTGSGNSFGGAQSGQQPGQYDDSFGGKTSGQQQQQQYGNPGGRGAGSRGGRSRRGRNASGQII